MSEDEDEAFAALWGLPGRGVLWGARPCPDPARSTMSERQQRHAEILARWPLTESEQRPHAAAAALE